MLNWTRIRQASRRLLLAGRLVQIESGAAYAWTIFPETSFEIPPAFHVPGAVERITGLTPWQRKDSEWTHIRGGTTSLGATRGWLIENVTVAGPSIYRGAARSHIGAAPDGWVLREPETPFVELDFAALVTTWTGSRFFGPYLMDDLALELLGPPEANVSLTTLPYGHEDDYRRLLGLAPAHRVERGRIRRMVLYRDPAHNPDKARRYRLLRSRLRERLSGSLPSSGPLVYLKRGSTGESRMLMNEATVEERLSRLGFDIVEPARLTAEEIARRTMDARVVVSVEGSHLSHCIYSLGERASLIILQKPDRFGLHYKEFTDSLGMRCGFAVGTAAAPGFTIDPDEVERLVDMAMAPTPAGAAGGTSALV